MKTARSLEAEAEQESLRIMAQQLVRQLLQLMPELEEVPAWPSVGLRRTTNELGTVVDRCLLDNLLQNPFVDYVD